ncbi:MAG: hypothetical protein ACFFC7_02650, partial [Candidatus Hermodarchaeota archaeon]
SSVGAVEFNQVRIGQEVITITEVDDRGGLVTVQTAAGPLKMSARALPNQVIAKNQMVFIIDRIGGHLVLDENPPF